MKLTSSILALAGKLALASMPVAATSEPARLPTPVVSEELTFAAQNVDVLSSSMSYIDTGSGDPVLFVHGNPTSSYLWRNVIPHMARTRTAPSQSIWSVWGPPASLTSITRSLTTRAILDAFVAELDLTDITLVGHDWGAALAWDFARRNPDRVNSIAFMEGVLPPGPSAAQLRGHGRRDGRHVPRPSG